MKNIKLHHVLFILVLIFPCQLKSQWMFNKQENVFDGEKYVASVIGYSNDRVYPRPILVVRYSLKSEEVEFYITEAGPSVCDNKAVFCSIDKAEVVEYYARSSIDGTAWFISIRDSEIIPFLENLQYGNRLQIRLKSNCSLTDLSFSLNGAEKALSRIKSAWQPVYLERMAREKAKELELMKRAEERSKLKARELAERDRIRRLRDSISGVLESKYIQEKSIYYRPREDKNLLSKPENSYLYDIMRVDTNCLLELMQFKNSMYKVLSVCSEDSCIQITGYVLITWIYIEDFIVSSNKVDSLDQLPRVDEFHVRNKEQNAPVGRLKVRNYNDEYYLIVTEKPSTDDQSRKKRKRNPIQPILVLKNNYIAELPFAID